MSSSATDTRLRILVPRAADQAADLIAALSAVGLEGVSVPAIAIETEPGDGHLDEIARQLDRFRWVLVSSANGARAVLNAIDRVEATGPAEDGARVSWAAIGSSTRSILERHGHPVAFEPSTPTAAALAAELPLAVGERVLVVRGDLAADRIAAALRRRGAVVDDVIGYRTHEAPEGSRELLARVLAAGPIAGVVLTSGSTARGLTRLAAAVRLDIARVPVVCIGETTAREAKREGLRVVAVSSRPDPETLARTAASALLPPIQETS
jgi:uroporphyrinogen-III synthase